MAKKESTYTLNLDVNVQQKQLKELQDTLGSLSEKGFNSGTLNNQIANVQKQVNELVKNINKDLSKLSMGKFGSASDVKKLAENINKQYGALGSMLGSAKGSLTNTFNSKTNQNDLAELRKMAKELERIQGDYEAIRKLQSQVKGIGNKSSLDKRSSEIRKELKNYDKKDKLTKAEKTNYTALKKELDEINQKLTARLELLNKIATIEAKYGVTSLGGVKEKINENMEMQNLYINNSISGKEYNSATKTYDKGLDILKNGRDLDLVDKATDKFNKLEQAEREAEQRSKTFGAALRELGIPALSLVSVFRGIREVIQYSFEYIKNLDSALTEISIVSGKTRGEVQELTSTFIELSAKTGMAVDQIAEASTIFYQQGLGDAAVKQLTEYTALFAKISGETVATAADQITAAMNGFGYAYTEVEDVVDKMSVLAAHSAASIDELATAMSKGASQAAMAGLTFDEYNAYLATMIETTREAPENLGTSLKTIMSRFQSIKSGDNTEDDTDVNAVETALKSVGVSLRDAQGQLRDLGDVLNDLGPKWEGLDRNTQAYLGTVIAGTRQQSRFISLMSNWDRALELTADSENSAGAATKMHQAAMEGLDASLNSLTNAWQEFISNLTNSDVFKGIIDTLTNVIKWFNQGNTALKLISGSIILFNAKTLLTNLSLISQQKEIKNADTAWAGLKLVLDNVKDKFALLTTDINTDTTALETNTEALAANTEAKIANANAGGANVGGTPKIGGGTGGANAGGGKTPVIPTGGKLKSFTTNAGKLLGKIQSITTAVSIAIFAFESFKPVLQKWTKTGEAYTKMLEEQYQEKQKEKEKQAEIVSVLGTNIKKYEELSRKVGKTAEEIEEMGQAAQNIADLKLGLTNGVDINGNPIVDVQGAKKAKEDAEQKLAEESIEQMKSIGEAAVNEVKDKVIEKNKTRDTVISGVAGTAGGVAGAAAGAKIGAAIGTAAAPGIGTAIGAGIGVLAGLFVGWGVSTIANNVEAQKKLQEDYNKVFSEERVSQMMENIANINNAVITDKNINGTTSQQRTSLLSYIGTAYTNDVVERAGSLIRDGKTKDATKLIEDSGTQYQALFGNGANQISERELAKIYKRIQQYASEAGDITFKEMQDKLGHLLVSVGIQTDDEYYKVLKEGLGNAAYSGISEGLYTAIEDIKSDLAFGDFSDPIDIQTDSNGNVSISRSQAAQIFNGLSTNQMKFYYDNGLFNDSKVFGEILNQHNAEIMDALEVSETNGQLALINILEKYNREWEEKKNTFAKSMGAKTFDSIDYDKLSDEEKEKYDNLIKNAERYASILEDVYSGMSKSSGMTWTQLADNIERITEKLQTMQSIMDDVSDNGRISFENFRKLSGIIDGIDTSKFSTEQLERYNQILNQLSGSWKVVDGEITVSAEGMKSMADLQAYLADIELESMRNKLKTKKAELEVNQSVLEAEKATLIYKLESLGEDVDATITADEAKAKADAAWATASTKTTQIFTAAQADAAKSVLGSYTSAFAGIADEWNALMTAMANGEKVTVAQITSTKDTIQKKITDTFKTDGYLKSIEENADLGDLSTSDKIQYYKNKLKAVNEEIKNNQTAINNVDAQLRVLSNDAVALADFAGGASKDSSKNAEEYIGKLREIYNILRRIEMLEHRLSMLDTYAEMVGGSDYGDLLQNRLGLAKQLIDQKMFRSTEAKKFENGYREFINGLDQIKGTFDFDEAGQIIINWDKYKSLSGEDLEIADHVYEKYQDLHKETMDYYTDLLNAKKKEIELNQEIVDSYIDIEKETADAIKEIYQQILDDKLEAIDKEIEALEELQEARQKAYEEQKTAQEVSGLQTNLQRAMLDTSGASDSAAIKAQQDLDAKLDEIAEDKYSEMLEDLKEQLEDEKEALQDNFDTLFEDLAWLYERIDEDLMTSPESIKNVLTQTKSWAEQSDAARNLTTNEWDKKITSYMSAISTGDGNTIQNIIAETRLTKSQIQALESVLKTQDIKSGQDIVNSLNEIKKIVSNYSSGGSSGSSGYLGNSSNFPSSKTEKVVNNGNSYVIILDTGTMSQQKIVPAGQSLTLPAVTKSGYTFNGWSIPSLGLCTSGAYTYKPTRSETVTALFTPVKASQSTTSKVTFTQPTLTIGGTNAFSPGLTVKKYATGGFNTDTGLAWLDGTKTAPEAVLNNLQTKHFIDFTDTLDKMYSTPVNGTTTSSNSSISIDTILFKVDSMSSEEDGEKAFSMFVEKFKEIGSRTGLNIQSYKNDL